MPGTESSIRWGILGCGRIAELFATGLKDVPAAKLVAVGSRERATADSFADRLGVERRHGSYEALAADPDVDVIYVATPHMMHKSATLLCLAAGKPVLCEKPFAINALEAAEMIEAAGAAKRFRMEAMWTRFTPLMRKVREILRSGVIGEVRMLSADLGFRAAPDRPHRLYDLAYGGGALMDVGVYVASFSSMVLGPPDDIVSLPTMGATGVDEQSAYIFRHGNGALSVLSTAIRTNTPHVATIMGTDGMIEIHYDWHKPVAATLKVAGQPDQRLEPPKIGNGYNYEAIEVQRCLREGLLESPILPLSESHSIVQTLDRIRAQWNLLFPMEATAESSRAQLFEE